MKTGNKNLFVLPVLMAGLALILVGRVTAQTFTTLHSFTARCGDLGGNSDGAHSEAGLILSGITLYGTATSGGTADAGTVFAMNTSGTGFTNLHSFTFSDGALPYSVLTLSSNVLYGTVASGGRENVGAVFAINTDGTGFTNLYSFTSTPDGTNSDGYSPKTGLILSGNTLYGTTQYGGTARGGTVFAINTDGTGFTNLHSFSYSDGNSPLGGLILAGDVLYGTTSAGGGANAGTVFAVNANSTGFTTLHSFSFSDGYSPRGGLILAGNVLYGTTAGGGISGDGTVFALKTSGTGFTNLHSFTAASGPYPGTNSDGAGPNGGLILSKNTLYGTTGGAGSSGNGTVFAVNSNSTGFTNLYNFTAGSANSSGDYTNSDGATPYAGLILTNSTLYGTTERGGSSGNGTVFGLSFRPQLTIVASGTNVILMWPTNFAGFDYTGFILQSAPSVTGTFTNIPGATNPYTDPISGAQKFYRLSQ